MAMCSPPYLPLRFGDLSDIHRLPADKRRDWNRGLAAHAHKGSPNDVPCFWLNPDNLCSHYKHRPNICRKLKPGSDQCQQWQDEFIFKEI